MTRRLPSEPYPLSDWFQMPGPTARVVTRKSDDRVLILGIQPAPGGTSWAAYALESDKASLSADVRAFFDNHAHAILGDRKTEAGARALCDRYAAKWEKGGAAAEPCACEEIGAAPKAKRPAPSRLRARRAA